MNRADSYQAGRADGERLAEADTRNYDVTREADLRNEAAIALYGRVLGSAWEAEAAYRLGVLRGYRSRTR